MLHEEVPYPERQPESSGTAQGFHHLRGLLKGGTAAEANNDKRTESVLHSLGALQDSGQLSSEKSRPFQILLQHLSPEQTDPLEQLDQLAHRLLFFDETNEWQQLHELTAGLGEVKESVATKFVVAFLDLASSAPDQELFGRVLETFSALVKRDEELIENVAYATDCSTKIAVSSESSEAKHEKTRLRIAVAAKALAKFWSKETAEEFCASIPDRPDPLAQEARIAALEGTDLNTPVIMKYMHWMADWDRPAFLDTEGRREALQAMLDSPSRDLLAASLCLVFTNGVEDADAGQLVKADELQGLILDLILEASKEGPIAEFVLAHSKPLRSKEISLVSGLGSLHSKVFHDGIPVAIAALNDHSIATNYESARTALLKETPDAAKEMKRLVASLLRFEERVVAYEGDKFLLSNVRSHASRILDPGNRDQLILDSQAREKLNVCLSGRGMNPGDGLVKASELWPLTHDLKAQVRLLEILNEVDNQERGHLLAIYVDYYESDNPPFSIMGHTKVPEAVQYKFNGQILKVMARTQDGYFGAWANTFEFRHTPIGKRCMFDEMAAGLDAKLFVVPAADFNRFPGRGRVITDIDIARVFPPDPDRPADPFHKWKEKSFKEYGPVPRENRLQIENLAPDKHALENLAGARITALRAFFAVSVPGSAFMEIEGENMTYIDWNHHFDATGAHMASLVPTRALHAIIDPVLLAYDPAEDAFPVHAELDIADSPPTLDAIREKARELGCRVGVVNLTHGSNINGGLCNGFDHGSSPYRSWERRSGNQEYKDGFGLSHKYHINHEPALTRKMWDAHERVHEVASSLQNVRDLFKIAMGRDARGDSSRISLPTSLQSEENYEGVRAGRIRKLQALVDFICESREAALPGHTIPNLVIAPMNRWAAPVSGPLVIDGYMGVAFQDSTWGDPIAFDIVDGKIPADLLEWWQEHVDPYLDANPWLAPRLVAREKTVTLMRKYGYKGS